MTYAHDWEIMREASVTYAHDPGADGVRQLSRMAVFPRESSEHPMFGCASVARTRFIRALQPPLRSAMPVGMSARAMTFDDACAAMPGWSHPFGDARLVTPVRRCPAGHARSAMPGWSRPFGDGYVL